MLCGWFYRRIDSGGLEALVASVRLSIIWLYMPWFVENPIHNGSLYSPFTDDGTKVTYIPE